MKILVSLLLCVVLAAQAPAPPPAGSAPKPAQAVVDKDNPPPVGPVPKPVAVGTMKEFMVDYLFPTSNAIFYVTFNENKTEKDWTELRTNALAMAEAANILMSPQRAYDNDRWMRDAKLLWDAGDKAYKAAKAKDLEALKALNDELYEACQLCHVHYRPGYRRRL